MTQSKTNLSKHLSVHHVVNLLFEKTSTLSNNLETLASLTHQAASAEESTRSDSR